MKIIGLFFILLFAVIIAGIGYVFEFNLFVSGRVHRAIVNLLQRMKNKVELL